MDKTKEYILQCEKAVEIQKLRKQDMIGSWFTIFEPNIPMHGRHTGVFWGENNRISDYPNSTWIELKNIYGATWLPRQDQLQGMVTEKTTSMYNLLEKFWYFIDAYWWEIWEVLPQHPSMEQLWLAFVMKERYQKIWNGTDWIKEDKK